MSSHIYQDCISKRCLLDDGASTQQWPASVCASVGLQLPCEHEGSLSLYKINKISCLRWKENKRLNMVW